MFTFNFHRLAIAACVTTTIAFCCGVIAHGQTIDTSHVLYGNSRCDHVISQVMRYGVNRSVDHSVSGQLAGSTPFGFASIPASEIGDLQIVSVHRCAQVSDSCGPRFTIVVMNQSQHRVDGIDVSIVALLGGIQPHSPNATVRTCAIEPGTAAEVEVTLPIEALSMGNNNGVVIGFQKLLVAIDSHDEWIEVNETNNVQAIAAAEIAVVTVEVTQVQTAISQPAISQPEIVLPNSAPASVPQSSVPTPASPETTDRVNVDELRMAVEKLGANTGEVAASSL